MKTISQMGESGFIQEISKILKRKTPQVLCGLGDDAAVLRFANQKILFTTDALLEGVHFDWRYCRAFLLGRKALSVNLSDIAAMGGKPKWAVISLAVPPNTSLKILREFYLGLQSCAREFDVEIVGGDTDQSKNGWKITVALIGEASHPIYRSGAKVGDEIWVTGCLGKSIQNPVPRVQEGQALAKHHLASSLIDISDGFLLDLEHLCKASRVGAQVYAEKIPKLSQISLEKALTRGEDYELIFTASPKRRKKLEKIFGRFETKLTCVGEVILKKNGVIVLDQKGQAIKISKKGYSHFS